MIWVVLIGSAVLWGYSARRFLEMAHWAEPDWAKMTFWLVMLITASFVAGSAFEKVLP